MPASQDHITAQTPLGASLVPGAGATFRVWAPNAQEVFISGDFNGWTQPSSGQLVNDGQGYWAGFIPGVGEGAAYKFFIDGTGSTGYKRDPYARELTLDPQYPGSNCVVRSPDSYPWHDQGFQMPGFNDLIIYQLHIGTYYGTDAGGNDDRRGRMCTFLDVLDRLEYLVALGVNAVEPLPVVEFPSETSEGYNGVDYYSPEMAYTIPPGPGLDRYFNLVNQLLRAKGQAPLAAGHARHPGQPAQGHGRRLPRLRDRRPARRRLQPRGRRLRRLPSLYFFDRQPTGDNNLSLYFTDQGYVGGLIFAYWNDGVRQFLIDNATFYLNEYHVDGFRYDEVTVIDEHGGWGFCQNLTDTVHFLKDRSIHIAEFWMDDQSWVIRPTRPAGRDSTGSGRPGSGTRSAGRSARRPAGPGRRSISTPSATASTPRPASRRPGGRSIASRTTTSSSPAAAPGSPGSATRTTAGPGTPGAARAWRPACS